MTTAPSEMPAWKAYLGLAATGLLLVAYVGPFVILGGQTFIWLRDGYWPALPLARTLEHFDLPYPMVSWLGVQKIIDWLCSMPTAAVLPIFGSVFLVVGGTVFEHFDRR